MDQKPRKKTTGKRSVKTPIPERVLCVCGHPVRSRHIEVWDTKVVPEGDVLSHDDEHNDAAADGFERGLHCSICNDFIRDEEGEPYDYTDIPELLAAGRLKLATGGV